VSGEGTSGEARVLESAVDGGGLRCDFCGSAAPRVRRVALDRDYDRLLVPHRVKYACSVCSDEKERSRLGLRG